MATLRQPPPGPVDPLAWRPSLPPIGEVCARYGDRSLLDGTGDGWAAFAASAIVAYRRTAAARS